MAFNENIKSSIKPFVGADFLDADFKAISEILLSRRAFDLGSYKDRCIKRRIAGRVRARSCKNSSAYVELLRADGDELDALLAILTIHVSQFFRNPSTFLELEENILPELLKRKKNDNHPELRIWSVGCSSGEEPYSIALLLQEQATSGVDVTILATDVSTQILEQAKAGEYDAQRLAEVPAAVRQKYFKQFDGLRFRVNKKIRDQITFEQQNILADQVYPQADLILCRNVMIYFSREEQSNILTRFARSLGPNGFLVLGRAETMVADVRPLYQTECPVERIYRCVAGGGLHKSEPTQVIDKTEGVEGCA
jgi:chemotaxis protein methyltransferase CheR